MSIYITPQLPIVGRRLLAIPAALAYGDAGLGGKVPPGAALLFDVQITKLKTRANDQPVQEVSLLVVSLRAMFC
jgi:hypothetical protein